MLLREAAADKQQKAAITIATYPIQQNGSRGERIFVCLALRRKAVHLQQHAHEDHWEPDEHRHGTFLIFSAKNGDPQTGPERGAFQQQAHTGVAVLKPKPAMPSSHPSRRVDDGERA
jgi:hypothetical protein